VDYYPSKYWAVGLPAYLCMLVVSLQVAYQGLNIFYCKPYQSFYTTEDELTRRGYAESTGIPEITDIPINVVNRVLYEYPKHKANNIK
jgi:phosphatidylinositol glycan class P protein